VQILEHVRPLTHRTGEELLLMAIGAGNQARRRIHRELDVRALLASGRVRARVAPARPTLRAVGLSHAA
jgi:hypothetical protein